MRTTINHGAPSNMQPCPIDNTSEHVTAQISLWTRDQLPTSSEFAHARVIHTQSAMEIAAWWHTPNNAFAPFASTGTITDELADEIATEIRAYESADEHVGMGVDERRNNTNALRALGAYVRACTVTPWAVGQNTAGYLPESDVYLALDYADAVQVFRDMVTEAPNALTDEAEVGDCSADGPCGKHELATSTLGSTRYCVHCGHGGCEDVSDYQCEYHELDAEVRSYLADDVPTVVNGRTFGDPRELSIALGPDSQVLPTVYWLQHGEAMTYGEYLSAREGE